MGAGDQHTSIRFYKPTDAWGELSNFALYPISLDDLTWPTSEHFFQGQKYLGTQYVEVVRLAATPWNAAEIGRDRRLPLRADWEAVKDGVMRRALRAKFTQHEDLGALLLSTGSRYLVEDTVHDSYWGNGGGSGRNMLGQLLMELRQSLASGNSSTN